MQARCMLEARREACSAAKRRRGFCRAQLLDPEAPLSVLLESITIPPPSEQKFLTIWEFRTGGALRSLEG